MDASRAVDEARDALIEALLERPDELGLLRRLGDLHAWLGRDGDAALLRRGYVPPRLAERHLGARELESRTVPSSRASGAVYRCVHPGVERDTGRRTSDAFTVTLANGRVWFDERNLVVTDREGHLLAEHVRGSGPLGHAAMRRRTPVHLPGRACFLDARSTQVYYHFMMDMLPKLDLLGGTGIDAIDHFVVPAAFGWQRDALEAYGVPRAKMIPSRPLSHYSADELVVPALNNDVGLENFDGMGLDLAPWVPQFHKRVALAKRCESPWRRVLLSRAPASGRHFTQADELERRMSARGFEIVRPETLAFADQARLMNESAVVVGAHGSALANCAFCAPGTALLEIFPVRFHVEAFRALAQATGMRYRRHVAEPPPPSGDAPVDPRELPVRIDLEGLMAVVDELTVGT